MLLWTRGGFTIVHKRLEKGRFTFPERVTPEASRVEIDAHELAMLLEGLAEVPSRAAALRRRPGSDPLTAAWVIHSRLRGIELDEGTELVERLRSRVKGRGRSGPGGGP
jgi:transposase